MSRKLVHLFCNDLHADMKIRIKNEDIEYPAHKLIIGHASDVLNKMVYGNGATLPTSTIIVPSYSSNDFLPVLKYLYTGNVDWTLENYHGTLEVAKYFGLTELENSFKIYVANTVNYDNALDIYARFFHVNDYVCRTAMKIIQLILHVILKSEKEIVKFFALPTDALSKILLMDELGVKKERDLFVTMMKWAKKTEDKELVSLVLANQLKLIRFADTIMQDHKDCKEYVYDKVSTRWKLKVINGDIVDGTAVKHVDDNPLKHETGLEHSTEIIQVTSRDKTIRLHGFSTLWSETVYVKTKDHFEATPCYRSKIFQHAIYDYMFEHPIVITPNCTVEIKIPVNIQRYDYEELDNVLFFVRTTQTAQAGKNLPIGAIFISMDAFSHILFNGDTDEEDDEDEY